MIQNAGTYKLNKNGAVRPWGGMNVIYVGDFLQLPPPGVSGTPLCMIPDNVLKPHLPGNATTQHGLNLLWNNVCPETFIELDEQVRFGRGDKCDKWWVQVLNECRFGAMTVNTHAFLHGLPTSVPGSWRETDGCDCGCSRCSSLCGQGPDTIKARECQICKKERARRCRVASGPQDPKLKSKKFKHAVTVVANNDIKVLVIYLYDILIWAHGAHGSSNK